MDSLSNQYLNLPIRVKGEQVYATFQHQRGGPSLIARL